MPTRGYTNLTESGGGGAAETNYCALHKTADGATTYYGTLTDAKDAAVSGDEIEVFAGTYNEKNLLKNGVNWYFHPGAEVRYTGSANGAIFDDAATTGTGGVVTCKIGGFGHFARAGSGSINYVFNIVQAASDISFTCEAIEVASSFGRMVSQGGNTANRINGTTNRMIYNGSFSNGFFMLNNGGFQSIDVRSVRDISSGSNSNAAYCDKGTQCIVIGNAERMHGVQCNGVAAVQVVSVGTTTDLSGNGIVCDSGNQVFEIDRFSGISNNGIKCNGGMQSVRFGTGASSSTNISCAGGQQFIDGDSFNFTGSTDAISITGGTQVIEIDKLATSAAAAYAIGGTAGTQRVLSTRIENTGAAGVPVNLNGQTLILEGSCSVVSEATAAVSINAAALRNLKIYGTSVGNKPLHANITPQVGTFINDANVV